MELTWLQKKEAMRELVDKYYANPLQKTGFVSYKDEGFHWYRIKGELLQTVRMPISSPAQPIELDLGFGAVPLFTWEHIAPSGASRDFDWDFRHGYDHFSSVKVNATCFFAQKIVGRLPRNKYYPNYYYHLDNGLLIGHLNAERCGAEALDEMILPVLDTMTKVEDIYQWNKSIKAEMLSCLSDEELAKKLEADYLSTDRMIPFLTLAFADECIYCQDECFYPIVLHGLKQHLKARAESPIRPKTKAQAAEWAEDDSHARVLVKVLETKNVGLFTAELERQKNRMFAQIRKKIPKLDIKFCTA